MRSILIACLFASANASRVSDEGLAAADVLARVASDAPKAGKEEKKTDAAPEAEEASNAGGNKLNFFIFDNAKMLYKNDWELYRNTHGSGGELENCRLAESDNWLGA
tara:strand:+ start:67 stop:387 length:321 start_codon:yes stop_codon:yes gene_type:complete